MRYFPFSTNTHIFAPKKIICLKNGDRGQLAFRASLGKSFLNFTNVFFLLKGYSKLSPCLKYRPNCLTLIWKGLKGGSWSKHSYSIFKWFLPFLRSSDFQTTVWAIVLYFCWVVVDFLESLSPFVLGVFPVSIELLCCVVSMWIYNIKSLEFRY